jgi:hypothetical protein
VRRGSGTAPTPNADQSANQRPASNAAFTDNGGDGGSSPVVPIAIAVAAGALVLGGTWLAAKRFLW